MRWRATARRSTTLAGSLVDDEITREEAEAYIDELIASSLLTTELAPAIVGDDILTTLIRKLQRFGDTEYAPTLACVQERLAAIDARPPGMTQEEYAKIERLIEPLGVPYDVKFLFQADLFRPAQAQLSTGVLTDLKEYVDFVGSISGTYQNGNLQAFQQAFVQRYETEEVPLMLAVGQRAGLGVSLWRRAAQRRESRHRRYRAVVWRAGRTNGRLQRNGRAAAQKIHRGDEAGRRRDHDRRKGFPEPPTRGDRLPRHDPRHVQPAARRCRRAVDLPQIRRVERRREPAGALLPYRRLHRRAGARGSRLRTAGQRGENHCGGRPHHRSAHRQYFVASVFRDYVIDYLSNLDETLAERIPASDLILSVRKGRFYLRSKRFDKEVIPRLTCAHNYSLSPIPMYRFLADMQSLQRTQGFGFPVGSLFSTLDYMPRIRYKNIVLSRRRWKLNYDDVKAFSAYRTEEHRKAFAGYMAERRLPRRVVHPMGDNELLLDLHDDRCVRLLFSLLRKYKTVSVEEFLFDTEHAVVHDEQANGYTNEMIVILHK